MKIVNKISKAEVKLAAPQSKSHTLRALIISSLAEGKSIIHNPLLAEDQLNVIECLKKLGVSIISENNTLIVHGLEGRYSPVTDEINVGESGVGMNFLVSAACYSDKPVIITGAEGLIKRPIKEVVDGIIQLGSKIEYLGNEGFPPVKIFNTGLNGGIVKIHGAKTSQYFSSIAIAAPYSRDNVIINCIDNMTEKPYFDITLQMMAKFGVYAKNNNHKEIEILKNQKYKGCEIFIEGDYSSASFFFLAAAICQAKVTLTGLCQDTAQGDIAMLDLLEKMGCQVLTGENEVTVIGNKLKAIQADMSSIPDLVPPMAIAAAFAEGTSRFYNIGHLRHKECDRMAVLVSELNKMGPCAACDDDSITITGQNCLHGASIDPHNDHRMAMSFAVAGLVTGNQIIENKKCVAKSFPDFWERFEVFYK